MKKRWIALLCAAALAVTVMGGAAAAGSTNTGTGPMAAGSEWNGIDLYASESTGQVKVIAQCDTGKMNVELMTGDGKLLKKQTLDGESNDNSLVYYIKKDAGQAGRYHLKWRGCNGQKAAGAYFWSSIPADGSQFRWNEVFGNQPWSADGTVTVRVNSAGTEERLPIYTSLYPYALREVTGALSDPDTFQGENGGLSRVDLRRDLSIAPMTYGNLPAMFYRFNANGKHVLIELKALRGNTTDGCDLLIKNETTGEFLAWVPGMIPGGGGIVLPTEYGTRYGIYAASGNDTLGTAQLSITDDLPINEAEVPDRVLLAETENPFRFPYKDVSIDGGGGDYSGCAYRFKLEDGENYFRVAVRNDLAPEIGNITVGIYREGDKFAYVSYDARPGEWTPPIVVKGVPGTTYTVILRKNAGTPELVQGLLSIKCAPGVFE